VKKTNWLIGIIAVESLLLVVRPSVPRVYAGIPDAGAQRDETNEQLKAVNDKLDKLTTLLSEGKLHVTVDAPAAGNGHE
jgi:hypothetical protein